LEQPIKVGSVQCQSPLRSQEIRVPLKLIPDNMLLVSIKYLGGTDGAQDSGPLFRQALQLEQGRMPRRTKFAN
jgi:hypothetical protein